MRPRPHARMTPRSHARMRPGVHGSMLAKLEDLGLLQPPESVRTDSRPCFKWLKVLPRGRAIFEGERRQRKNQLMRQARRATLPGRFLAEQSVRRGHVELTNVSTLSLLGRLRQQHKGTT